MRPIWDIYSTYTYDAIMYGSPKLVWHMKQALTNPSAVQQGILRRRPRFRLCDRLDGPGASGRREIVSPTDVKRQQGSDEAHFGPRPR